MFSVFSEERVCFKLLRQNAFQVIAVDGVCSGVIQCPSCEECTDWLQAIASNISALTKHNVSIAVPGNFLKLVASRTLDELYLVHFSSSCSQTDLETKPSF